MCAVEAGAKCADLCRKHGMSEGTFYVWKSKYGGMTACDPALTVDDIIRREGLGKGVVSRALPLAFLAPDIAGAILEGRQPEVVRRLRPASQAQHCQKQLFGRL